jgi:F-type H+-transporting ATPase subunit c
MFTTNKRVLAIGAGIFSIGLAPSSAFAQAVGSAANTFDMQAAATIGASLAIGLAVLGGALGQGRAAAAALEGISRNPGATSRIQTPMIIGLALIESLVLFAFAVAYLLQDKAG